MENLEIHNAIAGIMGFVQDCNKYVNDNKPWEIKDKEKLNKILYNLIEALRIASILIYPFMPETSGKINEQLGITNELPKLLECTPGLLENTKVKKGDVLFKKLEDKKK